MNAQSLLTGSLLTITTLESLRVCDELTLPESKIEVHTDKRGDGDQESTHLNMSLS